MKIVIAGAGVAGLAIGWSLAKAGASVEIVERGLAGHGATWASAGMLAPGAWMNLLPGLADILPPIQPVKGQMAAMTPPTGTALPKSLLWDEHLYLVPRQGRLLIGATVEDAGYDLSVARETASDLLSRAARIVPALSSWQLLEMWAGLRPRTPDDAPVLGETNLPGLYVAGGQFRNGILFAPVIADSMRRLLLGEKAGPDIVSFDPRRFTR